MTAGSLAGINGPSARALALAILESTDPAVIASDAHGRARMPALRSALDALAAAGVRDPGRFVSTIPSALLEHGLGLPSAARAA